MVQSYAIKRLDLTLTLALLLTVDCCLMVPVFTGVLGLGEEWGRGTGVEVPDGRCL